MIREAQVDIKHLAGYVRKLGANGKKALMRGLLSGALRSIPILQKAHDDKKANDTGAARRAWRTEPLVNGVRLVNNTPYMGVLEDGRRAGARMPPPDVIGRWAQRKLGLSREEAKSVQFVMARAIARKGIKPKHIVGDVLPQIINAIVHEAEVMLLQEMAR